MSLSVTCTYHCHGFICLMIWCVFVSHLYIPLSFYLSSGLRCFVSHLYKPLSLNLSRGLGCFVSPLHLPLSLHLSSSLMCLCQSPIYTYSCHFILLVSGVSLSVPVHTAVTLFVKWSEVSLSVTCIYPYYFISLVIWGVLVSL